METSMKLKQILSILAIGLAFSLNLHAETAIEITHPSEVQLIKEALRLQGEVRDGTCTSKEALLERDTYSDFTSTYRVSGDKKSFNIGGAEFIGIAQSLFNKAYGAKQTQVSTRLRSFTRTTIIIVSHECRFEQSVYINF